MIPAFDEAGNTAYITAATSTDRVALNITGNPIGANLRISVAGSEPVRIKQGGSTVEAGATSMMMLGNSVEVFPLKAGTTHLAVIADVAGSVVGITVGQGV